MIKIRVRLLPGSKTNRIIGFEKDQLKIKLQAQPEKGKANRALIAFLSKMLHLSSSHFLIVSGRTSKDKILEIDGIDLKEFREKVYHFLVTPPIV